MDYKFLFQERKKQVLHLLDEAISFYDKYGDNERINALTDLKMATEKGTFSIVVVGQFSAGKSTFLNALMGEKYLPSFATETTATINFLRSVKESPTGKPLIKVNYRNGSSETCDEVTLENIEKYVSTRGDNVAHNIESVEIFLDSKFLNDGVSLVDSPGLNGILEGHARITNEQIDRSHAAIFMFNALQPGSKSDFEILQRLNDRCSSVFIVLNQIDRVKDYEQSLDEVVNSIRTNYAKYFGKEDVPEICPVSSYRALVSRSRRHLDYQKHSDFSPEEKDSLLEQSKMEGFEERLFRFLTQGEKTINELLEPVRRVKKFLAETLSSIDSQIKDLESSPDSEELQMLIAALQEEIDNLQAKIAGDRAEIGRQVGDVIRNIERGVKSETREIREQYISRVANEEDLDDLCSNSQLYVNRMYSAYMEKIGDAMKKAGDEYLDIIRERLGQYASDIENRLNSLTDNVPDGHATPFKLDMSQFELDVDLDDFLKRKDELIRKLDETIERINGSDIEQAKVKDELEKRSRLEKEKADAAIAAAEDISLLGTRPGCREVTTYKTERHWGLGGFLKWVWNGNPGKQVPVITTDDSDRRHYDDEVARIRMEKEQKIESLNYEISRIPEGNLPLLELKKRQLEREQTRLENQLEDAKKEYETKLERSRRNKTKQAKAYLTDIFEKMEQGQMKECYERIRNMKDGMVNIAVDVLETGINEVVRNKTEILNLRKSQLSKSVEERAQLLEQKKSQKGQLETVAAEADADEQELLAIEPDTIKKGE